MQIYVIQLDSDLWQVGDFLRYSGSSTNKTDRYDIAEILLKAALKTITSNRSWVHLLLKCSYDIYFLCDSANDHLFLMYDNTMKNTTKMTTLSDHFQNPNEKSQKEEKFDTPNTNI